MPEVPPVSGRGLGDSFPHDDTPAAGRQDRPSPVPLSERVADAFAEGGPLAATLGAFEPRPSQVAMAAAVARTLEEGGVLLAEAGTGTGKTLAYLVPLVLSGQRAVISTGTKNLQEQIYLKDIPALQEALDIRFTATCMKGRGNYLCLHRLEQAGMGDEAAAHGVFLPLIREWAARTETGDRAELVDLPEDLPFWNEVSATADTCLGGECPRWDECFVTLMRQRAAASDVVIVNHHLLCADASVRQGAYGEVIPAVSHLVIDEAHQLEDVMTQYFGVAVSTYRVDDFARDLERLAAQAGSQPGRHLGPDVADLERSAARVRDRSRDFFTDLARCHRPPGAPPPRGEERLRTSSGTLAGAQDAAAALTAAFDLALDALARFRGTEAGPEDDAGRDRDDRARPGEGTGADIEALARRAGELRDDLRFLMRAGEPEYVYFVEARGRGVFLRAAPIDVSRLVREALIDRTRVTVLTSATLAVDESFDYVRGRLGLRGAAEIRVPSEFDFARQAILYLPPEMPDPRRPEFVTAASREICALLTHTEGRAFVLFTSYAALRAVQAVAELTLAYPILAQGTAPRTQLLQRFRETPHAVLFATSSFWQGVDVVGDALSCVIVDKLPFASPADPITAARIEAVRAQGGEPFGEYQVPLAVLTLQQGLGRLIRHRQDRGVLAVLDPRLRTMSYGRRFIASLPQTRIVSELDEVRRFMTNRVRYA